jgi:DNA-binding transcriptional LysR family regulator
MLLSGKSAIPIPASISRFWAVMLSIVIKDALGVRLLDRSPRGVEATVYGPPESVLSAILPAIIRRFSQQFPRAHLDIDTTDITAAVPKLRDRSLDVVMALGGIAREDVSLATDLKVEKLFNDDLFLVADMHSLWSCRGKGDLADLVDALCILRLPALLTVVRIGTPHRSRKHFASRVAVRRQITGMKHDGLAGAAAHQHGRYRALRHLDAPRPPVAMCRSVPRMLSPGADGRPAFR